MATTTQRAFNQLSLTRLPCSLPLRFSKEVSRSKHKSQASQQAKEIETAVTDARTQCNSELEREDRCTSMSKEAQQPRRLEDRVWWKSTSFELPDVVDSQNGSQTESKR